MSLSIVEWYGSKLAIFADPKHIPNGFDFEDDGFVDDHDEGAIDIVGIGPMDESLSPTKNESLHLGLKLHHVDDGLGNFVHRLKDWHEIMFSHNFVGKKAHE